jgi:hypothetical protein
VGGEAIHLEQIQQNYRSTDAIVAYGNALIARSGFPAHRQAQHVGRVGEAPALHPSNDDESIAATIIRLVDTEQSNGRTAIAIICKTIAGCQALHTALVQSGFTDHQFIDRRDLTYQGNIALFPSYLTKGLEFDTVIIADADSTTYAPDDINARLLYVAVTRASHTLHVCWTGTMTPLLDQAISNVERHPLFDGHLLRESTTISGYAMQNKHIDSDWCVERLAAADKLHLLRSGRIDPIVLEIVLRGVGADQHRASSETVLQPLDKAARQALREYMLILQMDRDPRIEAALAVTQLAYGLLRNQIRAVGLDPLDEADTDVTGQIALMLPLLQAVQEEEVTLSAGRWTTQQRAIQAADSRRRTLAEEVLTMLLDYGIVEATKQGSRTQVRVPQQWVQGLLTLGLGHRPDAWEQDILAQIPILPDPLHIDMFVEVV